MDVRVLKIVIASPSDVQAERDLLDEVVAELNQGIAADRGLLISVVRWEIDAYPGFHPDGPQGLIDSIIRIEDCDILIGIFWKRFGTPTGDAQSGTEHEFRAAYDRWKKKERPQIMFYFNQEAYAPKSYAETDQWGLILKFQEGFPKEGLWWHYQGKHDFERLVRRHLSQHIRNKYRLAVWRRRKDITPEEWQEYFKKAKKRIWLLGHCMVRAVDPEYSGEILEERLKSGVKIRLITLNPDEKGGQLQEIDDQHKRDLRKRIERTRKYALLIKKNAKEEWTQRRSKDGKKAKKRRKPKMSIKYTQKIIHSSIVIIDDHYLITPYSHNIETGDNGHVTDLRAHNPDHKSICTYFEEDFKWHYRRAQPF